MFLSSVHRQIILAGFTFLLLLSPISEASGQLLYPEPALKRQGNTTPPDDIGWVSMKQALEKAAKAAGKSASGAPGGVTQSGGAATNAATNASQKTVFIYVYAPWCPYCKKMNEEVLTNKKVQQVLANYFQSVQINTELEDPVEYMGQRFTHRTFARALENESIPTIYFMNSKGEVFANQPGVLPVEVLERLLHYVGTESYSRVSFGDYQMP